MKQVIAYFIHIYEVNAVLDQVSTQFSRIELGMLHSIQLRKLYGISFSHHAVLLFQSLH